MKAILYLSIIGMLVLTGFSCTKQQPDDATATVETASADYAEDPTEVNPILTGLTIPDVSVRDIEGDTVRLRELVSRKPTALVFYRGGWCPYCNKHMAELQQAEEKMIDMGYQILAVSPDRPELLRKSIGEHDLSYTLLSDSPMTASKAFGLAFRLDDETFNRYMDNGLDLTERSGYDHHLLPVPAAYLVGTDGKILFQYVNPDYTVRIKSNVLLAAAEAYLNDTGKIEL